MKTIFKITTTHLIVLFFVIFPIFVFAQENSGNNPPPNSNSGNTTIPISIKNPFNCGGAEDCTIMTLITSILNNIVMPIASVAVVMWIVWAGFSFIKAQGNPTEIGKAQQRLLWSLVGAGILLGAVAISAVVQNTVTALIAP